MPHVSQLTCPACAGANRTEARFCKWCGAPIRRTARALDALVGLEEVKRALEDRIRAARRMRRDGDPVRMNEHTVLVGASGTGKTRVAQLLFDLLREAEVVEGPAPRRVDAADLLELSGEGIEALFDEAKGGALVLDNAQDLVRQGGEMAPELRKVLGELDRRGPDPVVLVCGLPAGMRALLNGAPEGRFAAHFRQVLFLDEHDTGTLAGVARSEVGALGFALTPEAEARLAARCRYLVKESRRPDAAPGPRNGHLARREAEALVEAYYLRGGAGRRLLPEDVRGEVDLPRSLEEVMAGLDALVGLDEVKAWARELHGRVAQARRFPELGGPDPAPHAVITGNPGTGKTTLAPLLGELYAALGVLDTGHVVMADRASLVAGYVGQTAPKTHALVDRALGGVLFIDEAYALVRSDDDAFGHEALVTLLERLERDRGKFACVVAGYRDEMATFLGANPGLDSRFPLRFHLEDYSADALLEIFRRLVESSGRRLGPGALAAARGHLEARVARKTRGFGNAREARALLSEALRRQHRRLAETEGEPSREELAVLVAGDLPEVAPGQDAVEKGLARLDALVGLEAVKARVRGLVDTLEVARLRGDPNPPGAHFLFLGNPGTGKTTVARLLAGIFHAVGLLPTDHLVEVDRAALVSGDPSRTGARVHAACDRAMGGVLFLDEAYTLRRGGADPAGQEAIDILLKRMEDDRGRWVLIAAGYPKEMHAFVDSNPGLASRFTHTLEFEDYADEEMARIFGRLAEGRGLALEDGLDEILPRHFRGVRMRSRDFANARTARLELDAACERLARRVLSLPAADEAARRAESRVIRAADLPDALARDAQEIEAALSELDARVGLAEVKRRVREIVDRLVVQRLRGRERPFNAHMVFTGNPGTGKTMVARILADVFHAVGLLPTRRLVEVTRSDLVGEYVGTTAPKVEAACDRALGGVLFIDEAYTLAAGGRGGRDFGQEAIDTLLQRMSADEGRFVVVVAGYRDEMERFVRSNPGLASRFSAVVDFPDYDGGELAAIFERFAERQGYRIAPDARDRLRAELERLYRERGRGFGNARTVKRLFEAVEGRLARRVRRLEASGLEAAALRAAADVIEAEDLGPGDEQGAA